MITVNTQKHPFERIYLKLIQQNWLYRHLPRLSSRPFVYHYNMFRRFFAKTYPWYFLKKGDVVIQGGSSRALLTKSGPDLFYGPSQVLVMSAIVGKNGHVYVAEPIKENVTALLNYIVKNKIRNITIIEKGLYKQKENASLSLM